MFKAVSNNHFYFLKSFLTFKFPDSGPLPKPWVICLDNKNCHSRSCLCEIAAAVQLSVLWGKQSREPVRGAQEMWSLVALGVWWLLWWNPLRCTQEILTMRGAVKEGIMGKKQCGVSAWPGVMAKSTYRAQLFSPKNGDGNNPGSESCYEDSMTIVHIDGVMSWQLRSHRWW